MKVSVKVTGSSGSLFGGTGNTVETKIEVDEEGFDTAGLMEVTHALGAVAGVIVRDIERRAEPATDPDVGTAYDGDADSEDAPEPERTEDGTHVRDTGGTPDGAGDVVRLTWTKDGGSRLFFDTGEHYYSPEVVGKFATPMAVEYGDPEVHVSVIARLGETQGKAGERAEHPALSDIRASLGDAVLIADEAQEIRNLALNGERRGDERGITHGR
ncbi:hypothetical protein SEA_MEMENTOMORI_60 [Microbacterium phage MementoMori]|uniref:Uncharacterized protein n=1 Tax=Microbacterium phage MementoMori TaxID=2201436 RepID=A0A2Z4Q5M9_9CAUD|nr:hypothetical protein HOT41_gp49 [Microbacterium phage MementoMori]AWY05314.1 hypothetical protein SEA_MEMENTOMORI_60 [Microbacterium phage MementoMori]